MKLDVKRRDDRMVEIHVREEDGKIAVYLCEDDQAAIFKLAHLLFSVGDDPKENRRSILVGTFEKKEKKPSLSEKAKDVLKELKKAGLVPVDSQKPKPITYPYTSPVDPNLVPIGIGSGTPYPISIPGTVPPNPISIPNTGTGTLPYTVTWGSTTGYTTTTNSSSGSMWVDAQTGQIMYSNGSGEAVGITEKKISPPVGMASGSGEVSSCYYVSMTSVGGGK